MSGASAPFYDDVAEAPAGAVCQWLTTSDGLRLRAACWRDGAKGTVLLFPGRTEYIEKYGPAADEFARRGYAMACIDWRGQGLSDRLLPDRMPGHVAAFADYQKDVAALIGFARSSGLPEPFYLVAHSMGGAIGLRALIEGLPVKAVAFTAPMWGIRMQPLLRPVAWMLSALTSHFALGHHYVPSSRDKTYVSVAPFAMNTLTRDPGMYAFMQRQVAAHPDLALGGPTHTWLYESLQECRALAASLSPALPCLLQLGSLEQIVDTAAIHARMARWPGAIFDLVPGAAHEVMMEGPAVRAAFYDRAATLFGA
ncbi:MAG: alpha/beta hydrolase, partial [Rhodobacteraceae bacterium]|nr:alpha/beta hydrolase [Paracoccaceae bacterium]